MTILAQADLTLWLAVPVDQIAALEARSVVRLAAGPPADQAEHQYAQPQEP